MELVDQIVAQLMQPYFYYSVGAMLAAFLAVALVLRFTKFFSHRVRSYLHLIPLFAPLFMLYIFPPKLYFIEMSGVPPVADHLSFVTGPFLQFVPPSFTTVFSYTGLLCIAGLLLGVMIFTYCMMPTKSWLKRSGVIYCSDEDFPETQMVIRDCAARLGLEAPRMGILEDLRPNAFIAGRGKGSVVILSLGLLDTFTPDEVQAAIAHEMMHLRHGDHIFRSITMALTAASFFNPLAYFSATAALREREHWADTGSVKEGYSISALEDALRKVSSTPSSLKVGAMRGMNLWLLASSPLLPKRWLAFHPSVDQRIEAIKMPDGPRKASWVYVGLALTIITLLCFTMLISLDQVRDIVVAQDHIIPPEMIGTGFNVHNETMMHQGNMTLAMDMHHGPPPPF